MSVLNITSLNAKAREHVEWAIDWLNSNDIPATIEQRGNHPVFVIERLGNKRRITFSGSPSVIQPNAVFRDVRIAALELGYEEKFDREGMPTGAFAALKPRPVKEADPAKTFMGIPIPEYPPEFIGRDKRGLASSKAYSGYLENRREFVRQALEKGETVPSIYAALKDAGHDVSDSLIYLDKKDIETGKSYAERKNEREANGHVPKSKGRAPEDRIVAKKVPRVQINGLALLIEEAARQRLSDLILVRDNLRKDADAYDDMRAQLKKGGGQLESLLAALAE